jgi:hypothetical protein
VVLVSPPPDPRRLSATLAYLALAPVIGGAATIAAIQNEQHA